LPSSLTGSASRPVSEEGKVLDNCITGKGFGAGKPAWRRSCASSQARPRPYAHPLVGAAPVLADKIRRAGP